MIHYQLRCDADHAFDGWFPDSAGFDAQAARGLVECPACGSAEVRRALMAPAVPAKRAGEKAALVPDEMRAKLQRMRAEIEARCEHVGPDFADEARRIHNGDSPERAISGDTTPEQAEDLADEGIQVARIPWVPRADG